MSVMTHDFTGGYAIGTSGTSGVSSSSGTSGSSISGSSGTSGTSNTGVIGSSGSSGTSGTSGSLGSYIAGTSYKVYQDVPSHNYYNSSFLPVVGVYLDRSGTVTVKATVTQGGSSMQGKLQLNGVDVSGTSFSANSFPYSFSYDVDVSAGDLLQVVLLTNYSSGSISNFIVYSNSNPNIRTSILTYYT